MSEAASNVTPLFAGGGSAFGSAASTSEKIATGGGGGGGGGPTVDAHTRDYVDKSMQTVTAQNDARFSEVLGRLDGLKAQIDHAPVPLSFTQFLIGALSVAGVVLALVFAVLAYASDRFDGGLAADAIKDQIAEEQIKRDATQDAKLDQIIKSIESLAETQSLQP